MEDYMGEISRNNNNNNNNNRGTNLLYCSSGGNSSCLYGGREEETSDPAAGGFHHHLQYNHNHHLVVKIESSSHNYNQPACSSSSSSDALKAKIISHPHYSNLLQAYTDCQKVGAPPEVVGRLTAVRQEYERGANLLVNTTGGACRDNNYKDPELDQFMEAYYDMLIKYKEELTRPIEEAMEFMRRIESQLSTLTLISSSSANNNNNNNNYYNNNNPSPPPARIFISPDDNKCEVIGSSEEEHGNSGGETEVAEIDPQVEDRELKNHLLRKYSGYLSSLKQELSKKKKKGKLPKEARQKLLNWWDLHYKWPYPSESEKVALAESTGLDQKQINNWFINQRKRHWKPSEDMQFMVMDGLHPQNAVTTTANALYMEGHYMSEGPYRLGP